MLLLLIAVTQIQFAYLAVDRLTPIKFGDGPLVQRGQRPAPAGQLAGDRDVGHHVGLLAFVEPAPLLVQAPVAGMAAILECRDRPWPSGPASSVRDCGRPRGDARPTRSTTADMGVAGLGDRTLHP